MDTISRAMIGTLQGKVDMPILRPVAIPTKGLSFIKRLFVHFSARKWELMEDYFFYVPWLKKTIVMPKGFVFDMASVPRIFWPIISPTGILLLGSLIHDFGYRYDCLLDDEFNIIYNKVGRGFFDQLLKDVSVYINGTHILSTIAWFFISSTLKLFGFFAWNGRRKEDADVTLDFINVVTS